MNTSDFDRLIDEALTHEFSGWDFSWLAGRWHQEAPSWDYPQLVRDAIAGAGSLLDMDTGGGEVLSSLGPLPAMTVATESYPPNILVAQARLEPLGVQVVTPEDDQRPPFADAAFDVVTNRHGAFDAAAIHRVLRPGGVFITQQVGGDNCIQLNQFLQDEPAVPWPYWTLDYAVRRLAAAGFTILRTADEYRDSVFLDIGAVVFYLRIIQWQIQGFSVDAYRDRLWRLHQVIQRDGAFVAKDHRFLIHAGKSGIGHR